MHLSLPESLFLDSNNKHQKKAEKDSVTVTGVN